jgi:hypothetical protein
MKSFLLGMFLIVGASACTINGSGPVTGWGKPGVSKVDYGTDVGMCTGLAALQNSGNGANTAGGINGQNGTAPSSAGSETAKASQGAAAPGMAGAPTSIEGGAYRGMASQDMVQRAATQESAQQMAARRQAEAALKGCLVQRGYQEYRLTPEQRAHIATLEVGSNEYHEYLYSLGADPAVLSKQGLPSSK